jgi:AAA+ superfamily predicted ATPase
VLELSAFESIPDGFAMTDRADPRPYADNSEHLADELRRLDLLIELWLAGAGPRGEAVPVDPGSSVLFITRTEVDRLLAGGTGAGAEPPDRSTVDHLSARIDALSAEIDTRIESSRRHGEWLGLPTLGRTFGLSALERAAVTVCLAPELRRRYDRLYAYLQDDITRKRPSVDLILELLCRTERERWAARGVFAGGAPLLRHGILRPVEDPHSPSGSSALAQFISLDPQILQYLLGNAQLDAGLTGRARMFLPGQPATAPEPDPALSERLVRLIAHWLGGDDGDRQAQVLYLRGPAGAGKLELARKTSHRLGLPLLSIDAGRLGTDAEALLRLAFRDGLLHGAAVHVAGVDALGVDESRSLLAAVAEYSWLVFLTGESEWAAGQTALGDRILPVAVPLPDLARSTAIWAESLADHPPAWAAELAGRYELPAARIPAAVRLAHDQLLMGEQPRALTLADLSAACRQLSTRSLDGVMVKLSPRADWDDLVLPTDSVAQLHEACDQFRHRHRVFSGWGFGAKHTRGRGLSALFSGPPGTGKTMAGEVLAGTLGLDLYRVDLSGVVSKYIGETEKNLSRIFSEARTSNAILFFDEADALFGKRTRVSDAHDRYANIETSYLLQKMEEYDGVVVLATNMRQNLDDAFVRRIRFVVDFPFPTADSRRLIWRSVFPPTAPLADDMDFAVLAEQLPISGGEIKNIALGAAFLAAADGGVITRQHIRLGARREFDKIGKLWSEPPTAEPSAAVD